MQWRNIRESAILPGAVDHQQVHPPVVRGFRRSLDDEPAGVSGIALRGIRVLAPRFGVVASHLLGGGHSAELREQGGDLIGRSGECFLNGWGESDSRGDLFGLNANYKQPVR